MTFSRSSFISSNSLLSLSAEKRVSQNLTSTKRRYKKTNIRTFHNFLLRKACLKLSNAKYEFGSLENIVYVLARHSFFTRVFRTLRIHSCDLVTRHRRQIVNSNQENQNKHDHSQYWLNCC